MPILTESKTAPGCAEMLRLAVANGIHRIGEIEIESIDCNDRLKQDDDRGIAPFQVNAANNSFKLCHADDAAGGHDLAIHQGPAAARELASYAEDGSYRFLKAQRNLRRGWVMLLESAEDLRLALDQFYPACVGLWLAQRGGSLEVEHLRSKLQRQSGMYQRVRALSDDALQALVPPTCSPAVPCARRILWQIDAHTPLLPSAASSDDGIPAEVAATEAIPLLCREACNHFVAECLAAAKAQKPGTGCA